MRVKIDIEFNQLLKIVKGLPSAQLKQLMAELKLKTPPIRDRENLESILINGPVATKKQLEIIAHNRKAMNEWRKKKF